MSFQLHEWMLRCHSKSNIYDHWIVWQWIWSNYFHWSIYTLSRNIPSWPSNWYHCSNHELHYIFNRLKCAHSSTCMTKKEVTQEASTLKWLGRTWPSALVDHGLWPSMTWATATTHTVTQGWTPPSPWSLPSSLQRGSGRGGCGQGSTTACHCLHWLSE